MVCVGGSAGGLDAYIRLLRHLPADLGVAVVIVNHLRLVATQLHEILPRYTPMPVELITQGLNIKAVIGYLQQSGWEGAVSIECHGSDENTWWLVSTATMSSMVRPPGM